MHSPWLGEFLGTLMLILLGNGVVAGVTLRKSYAADSGWIVITTGWALAVMCGVMVAQGFGSHDAAINPDSRPRRSGSLFAAQIHHHRGNLIDSFESLDQAARPYLLEELPRKLLFRFAFLLGKVFDERPHALATDDQPFMLELAEGLDDGVRIHRHRPRSGHRATGHPLRGAGPRHGLPRRAHHRSLQAARCPARCAALADTNARRNPGRLTTIPRSTPQPERRQR